MSDMTALSHQYSTNATFAEQVNSWVLAVKKASLGVPAEAQPTGRDLSEAQTRLIEVLDATIGRLEAASGGQPLAPETETETLYPEEVYERVQTKHQSDLAWFLQDLRETRSALEKSGTLDSKLLTVLDEFSDAADGLASESFRRLWRR
jgi:hypothetical protein